MDREKPEVRLDLIGDSAGALRASGYLAALKSSAPYFRKLDIRHPLGTYNLSVGRVADKIAKCASKLENLWLSGSSVDDLNNVDKLIDETIDYLELSSYAAAEHVDDINTIASSFFVDSKTRLKSPIYRSLQSQMKPLRDRISSITNTIKHGQGRLRIFSLEVTYTGVPILLHGFFIEGFQEDAACPHHILHGNGETIISVTSYLWTIIIFVERMSDALCDFIHQMDVFDERAEQPAASKRFADAVLTLARLPNYSLDDPHPFQTTRLILNCLGAEEQIKSDLYGSVARPWAREGDMNFGASSLRYEGDGVTKNFKMVLPKTINLHHWD